MYVDIIKRVFPGMSCTPDVLESQVDQSIMYIANKCMSLYKQVID